MRTVLFASLVVLTGTATGLELDRVRHEPAVIDPLQGEIVSIRFHLSEPGEVTASFYDARHLLVGRAGPIAFAHGGEHELNWNGLSRQGHPVPPEAYTYVLEARSGSGEITSWDLSDTSGGSSINPSEVAWDPETGQLSYRIPEPSRVRVRIGLARNGPLLRTLVDWVPRSAGFHADRWDGTDASDTLDISRHPALSIAADAFSLSRNSIIVGPASSSSAFLDLPEGTEKRRFTLPKERPRLHDYPRQAPNERSDYPLQVALPEGLDRNSEGLNVIDRTVAIRVSLPEQDLERAWNEGSEAMFFVDGKLLFENEVAFLPMTWRWDPAGTNPGIHYLTVNLIGYNGSIGIGTLKAVVKVRDVDDE